MLNKTQENIIKAFIQFPMEDIEELPHSIAIKVFESIISEKNIPESIDNLVKTTNCLESISQIKSIFEHKYPQNRSTGSPYVGQENGYAVYEPNGHGNGIAKEPIGLLSLTAYNDSTTEPVTKDDVISYVIDLLQTKVNNLKLQQQLHRACENTNNYKKNHRLVKHHFKRRRAFERSSYQKFFLQEQQRTTQSHNSGSSSVFKGKKITKNVAHGEIEIDCTYNNSLIVVKDLDGNKLLYKSAGSLYRGTMKATPRAGYEIAKLAAEEAINKFGMQKANIVIKQGCGPGRDFCIRAIKEKMEAEVTFGPPLNETAPRYLRCRIGGSN